MDQVNLVLNNFTIGCRGNRYFLSDLKKLISPSKLEGRTKDMGPFLNKKIVRINVYWGLYIN